MLDFKESGQIGTTMPVINGQEKTWNGQIGDSKNEVCHIQGKCKTIETGTGHFNVIVHYSIYLDALKKNVVFDRTLKILPMSLNYRGEPAMTLDSDGKGWVTVDHNIKTAAYFIDPTVTVRD